MRHMAMGKRREGGGQGTRGAHAPLSLPQFTHLSLSLPRCPPCMRAGPSASYPLVSGGFPTSRQKQDLAASASASAAELAAIVERVKKVLPGAVVALYSVHGGTANVSAKDAVEVRPSPPAPGRGFEAGGWGAMSS